MTIVWILSYLATYLLGVGTFLVGSYLAVLKYEKKTKEASRLRNMPPPRIEDRVYPQPPPPMHQNNQN
jgi:hypothetical protein